MLLAGAIRAFSAQHAAGQMCGHLKYYTLLNHIGIPKGSALWPPEAALIDLNYEKLTNKT